MNQWEGELVVRLFMMCHTFQFVMYYLMRSYLSKSIDQPGEKNQITYTSDPQKKNSKKKNKQYLKIKKQLKLTAFVHFNFDGIFCCFNVFSFVFISFVDLSIQYQLCFVCVNMLCWYPHLQMLILINNLPENVQRLNPLHILPFLPSNIRIYFMQTIQTFSIYEMR